MITPKYLEGTVEQIVLLYEELQEIIIRDIVERLLNTNFDIADTVKWRIEKLQQAGMVYDEVLKRLSEVTGKSEAELKRIFEDAGIEVFSYDEETYRELDTALAEIQKSPLVKNILMAGLQATAGTMKNLVNTTAIVTESAFLDACDNAYMMIASGAFSYNEAIVSAVGQAGSAGAFVHYPTGHRDRIDVAVRRAVLSGLGQTVGKLNEILCDELDCDLVEVTAHWNARPSHAEWQGLVYSRSGKNKDYPDFAICGYGTGDGLLGWNCYHDFHPFIEGISERMYTDTELERMKNNTVTYNGKTMTGYEATKIQRSIERNIRDSKRKLIAYDHGIKNSSGSLNGEFRFQHALESRRLNRLNGKLNDFCKQTGFQKQYDRARVQGFGRSQAQKAVQASKKGLTSGVKSGMIKSKLNSYGDHLRTRLGSALENNKDEVNRIVAYVESRGGKVLFSARKDMFYNAPGNGVAGNLEVDEDCSIAALRHEFRHFLDDEEHGFIGIRMAFDRDAFWKREFDGYMEEIRLARKYKEYDAGRKILDEMRKRKGEIYGNS